MIGLRKVRRLLRSTRGMAGLALTGMLALAIDVRAEVPESYQKMWSEVASQIDAGIERHRKGDAVLEVVGEDGRPVAGATLEIRQANHAFLFGCNLFALGQLSTPELNGKYETAFVRIHNFATLPFYWRELEPEEGKTRFAEGSAPIWRRPPPDLLLRWCQAHGITAKGHALMYSKTMFMPDWIKPDDPGKLKTLAVRHMRQIAERYGKQIAIWDVVNEELPRLAHPREWHAVPDDYLAWCFEEAGRLFPAGVRLLINDGIDQSHVTTGQYAELIKGLLTRRLRAEGIGIQFHTSQGAMLSGKVYSPKHLMAVYEQLGRLGLPLYITEITVPGAGADGPARQAAIVVNLYRLWFSTPAMAGITWWNLADGTAYKAENAALGGLLDAAMNPKPAYEALDRLINHDWRTNLTSTTDAQGKTRFRGFLGKYVVKVAAGDSRQEFTLQLTKAGAAPPRLVLRGAGSASAPRPARPPKTLVDASLPLDSLKPVAIDARISQAAGRLRVETGRTAERPGMTFQGPGGRWDLTGFAAVEAVVKNVSRHSLTLHAAIESPGADRTRRQNCSIESVTLAPGGETTVKVPVRARVPKSLAENLHGMRGCPGGFVSGGSGSLDPAEVVGISFYLYRPNAERTFEVASVRASGTPAFPLPERIDDLFPMIDEFGQYIHKRWPDKTQREEDLAQRRTQEAADLAAHPGPAQWNRYGGWLGGPKLEATGRFRVAKWQDKWWMVDPEGRLFWSHGLVRVTWSCGYTPITGREHLFAFLPPHDSPLGAFYGRSTWAISGLYPRGAETYNFSGANLLRKYGPEWPTVYADVVHRRLRSWGLNTMANCSQPAIYLQRKTPYTATVYSLDSAPADTPGATGYVATIHDDGRVIEGTSGGWGKFPDVFDPSFKAVLLKEVAEHKGKAVGDPWCLGYFPGNELNWGGDEAALGRAVLASPADQPAKRTLVDDLKAKYATIQRLNGSWKTAYPSWDALLRTTVPPRADQGREDLAAFLGRLADAYFRQCREAVKEVDPEGLYLGCRFAGWSHGVVFRTAAKYSDVISVNRYTETLSDLRLPDGIDKPVLIGEWHFGALDRGKFHGTLRPVADQRARGEAYQKYVVSALKNPLVVGVHWHQFGDQATTGRDDGENFQNGFVDVCDTPYAETIDACRRVGDRIYDIRSRQDDSSSHPPLD